MGVKLVLCLTCLGGLRVSVWMNDVISLEQSLPLRNFLHSPLKKICNNWMEMHEQ